MKFFKILGGGVLTGQEFEARLLLVDENNNLVMSFRESVASSDESSYETLVLAGDSGCFLGTIDSYSSENESDLFYLSDEEFAMVWDELRR